MQYTLAKSDIYLLPLILVKLYYQRVNPYFQLMKLNISTYAGNKIIPNHGNLKLPKVSPCMDFERNEQINYNIKIKNNKK